MTRPHEFAAKIMLAAFRRAGGRCEACSAKITAGAEYDHVLPVALGGESTLDNCQVLCRACHAAKTAGDVKQIRKADRQARRNAGIGKARAVMPGSRRSKWKRTISGETVPR